MTSEHFQACLSMELSTSYMEAFRARTSVLLDMERAWRESEADCFSRSKGLPTKYALNLSSSKTYRLSLLEVEQGLLAKLPRWGMIADGWLYPLRPAEHLTKEIDGSYLPTPTARDAERNGGNSPADYRRKSPNLPTAVRLLPTPDAHAMGARRNQNGHQYNLQDFIGSGKLNPPFVSWMMGYPSEWTSLEPWVIPFVLSKQKKRLKS
jgi:hypothetical protein